MPATSRTKTKRPRKPKLTMSEIQAQLRSREQNVQRLLKRRTRVLTQLESVDEELFDLTGVYPSSPTRKRNESTLGDVLADALTGRELTIDEAVDAARDAGYVSSASSFKVIVAQRLIADPRIKRVRRGIYTAKAR